MSHMGRHIATHRCSEDHFHVTLRSRCVHVSCIIARVRDQWYGVVNWWKAHSYYIYKCSSLYSCYNRIPHDCMYAAWIQLHANSKWLIVCAEYGTILKTGECLYKWRACRCFCLKLSIQNGWCMHIGIGESCYNHNIISSLKICNQHIENVVVYSSTSIWISLWGCQKWIIQRAQKLSNKTRLIKICSQICWLGCQTNMRFYGALLSTTHHIEGPPDDSD